MPIVSVCVTTYNLESYISEALDSLLKQQTQYSFEIVICDDCSRDKTCSIIKKYQLEFPNKIRLIEAEKNLGMLPNFIKSLNAAQGKYIAVCDGDDYWIDPFKLEKQVSFLESNSDFSACYGNSYVLNQETGEKIIAKNQIWDVANSEELLLHDDFKVDNVPLSPGHISAFVFRNVLQNNYPKWFYEVDGVTDFPLYLMLSKFGKAKFINEPLSVYRIHSKSTSTVEYEYLRVTRGRIFMYEQLNLFLDQKFKTQIQSLINRHYLRIAKIHLKNKHFYKSFVALMKVFFSEPTLILKTRVK